MFYVMEHSDDLGVSEGLKNMNVLCTYVSMNQMRDDLICLDVGERQKRRMFMNALMKAIYVMMYLTRMLICDVFTLLK